MLNLSIIFSFEQLNIPGDRPLEIRHLISGQRQDCLDAQAFVEIPDLIRSELDAEKVFWWLWRFFPGSGRSLLYPAHRAMPDCSKHSYESAVTAISGGISTDQKSDGHPSLLLFTFSPVQEFIKSSRKFLDFWSGSYLLHYLSATLCWRIAQEFGPDAVITPSLWDQAIIDAFLVERYPSFTDFLAGGLSPGKQYENRQSTQLTTAGFPNILTVLLPSQANAEALGQTLKSHLSEAWYQIGDQVRRSVTTDVIEHLRRSIDRLKVERRDMETNPTTQAADERDLERWQTQSCWEWRKLWDTQLNHTWECYWVSVPVGDPAQDLSLDKADIHFDSTWIDAQNTLAQNRDAFPSEAELTNYDRLNVGVWWGRLQARLGRASQAIKNTRIWRLPASPGERSSLSGQFSALHPALSYTTIHRYGQLHDLREGGGLPAGTLRLFWWLMSKVYPGVFDGSEKLNAIELTKRLAWSNGGVAARLGVPNANAKDGNFDALVRFPNLSSIAAASFFDRCPSLAREYWCVLEQQLQQELRLKDYHLNRCYRETQIPRVDSASPDPRLNGVIFSAKWLAEDLGFVRGGNEMNGQSPWGQLRQMVQKAHHHIQYNEGSPADWWVLIKADGDGMGQYISGRKLQPYKAYLTESAQQALLALEAIELLETSKRMGPATHVGLNRALLDFSNRLVPYLTEHRFCGKVIYSGGDDVMVVLPLSDLPDYLLSLRAAWSGADVDPGADIDSAIAFHGSGGYWHPNFKRTPQGTSGSTMIPDRPLFTMGDGATMSLGITIAHRNVPLPTVLDQIWSAESDRAKKLQGNTMQCPPSPGDYPHKDGLCLRVLYGSGNVLEGLMKGHLLAGWRDWMRQATHEFCPVLLRLAEILPKHVTVSPQNSHHPRMLETATRCILADRDRVIASSLSDALIAWINDWEDWAIATRGYCNIRDGTETEPLGGQIEDLANLLRFSAFWLSHALPMAMKEVSEDVLV